MKNIFFENKKVYPSKIVCIGRNYADHIKEMKSEATSDPVVFIKPNSAISPQLTQGVPERNHYEGEMCFLIYNSEIAGLGFGLDLTKRKLQTQLKSKGLPWERSKAFDKSAVFSTFVAFNSGFEMLSVELYLNTKLVQRGSYAQMLFKPIDILLSVSQFLTLEDGDIIMTGTPEGVGELNAGDTVRGLITANGNPMIDVSWLVESELS